MTIYGCFLCSYIHLGWLNVCWNCIGGLLRALRICITCSMFLIHFDLVICVSLSVSRAWVSERRIQVSAQPPVICMYVFMALDNQTRIHSVYIGCVAPHVQNLDSFTQKTLFVRCVCVFFLYLFFQLFLVPWHFECMCTHWNRDKHTHTWRQTREF